MSQSECIMKKRDLQKVTTNRKAKGVVKSERKWNNQFQEYGESKATDKEIRETTKEGMSDE